MPALRVALPAKKSAKKAMTKSALEPAKKAAPKAVSKAATKVTTKPSPKTGAAKAAAPQVSAAKASAVVASASVASKPTSTLASPKLRVAGATKPSSRDQTSRAQARTTTKVRVEHANDFDQSDTAPTHEKVIQIDEFDADLDDDSDDGANEGDADGSDEPDNETQGDAPVRASFDRDEQSGHNTLVDTNSDTPREPVRITHTPETTIAFALDVARMLRDDKSEDVVVLDVRGLSTVSDYIVIASGTSDRQMHSSLKHAIELGASRGQHVMRTSSDERKSWLIADFVDVMLHLFEPNVRAHYDIEMLWGDAPRLEWERADQRSRDHAGLGTSNAAPKKK